MQSVYFKTKRVHIFINGHPESKAFYIHPRCRLGWNAILDCFSRTLKPYFGAIRVLRTVDGRKVIEGFNDLQHEGKYVACGIEAFRPIKAGYLTCSEQCKKNKPSEYYPADELSPDEQKKYPCLIETMRKGRTIIYVFANGKRSDPRKIVLIRSDYEAWDSILTHIGIILDIPEGVKGLYTVFGHPLCRPHEVQHGGFYVAIPFGATFKPIKYHIFQRSKSYHESSPMVTKDVYISAAKHCTILDGIQGKRIKLNAKMKDYAEEENREIQNESEHHVKINKNSIKRKEGKQNWDHNEKFKNFLKKRVTGYPGTLFFEGLHTVETPETLNQEGLESAFQDDTEKDTDIEFIENEVLITNYIQKEKATQTHGIFLEATHDADNSLIFKQKKYFLISENKLQKIGDIDKSAWCLEILPDWLKEEHTVTNEEEKEEVEWVAGAVVGVIINISERIANRSVFGDHMEEMGEGRLSLIPDTLQPKKHIVCVDQPVTHEIHSSISSKDKNVRLSIPIGRKHSPVDNKEPIQDLGDAAIQLHSLDKEFHPLTPTHESPHKDEEIVYLNIEEPSDLSKQESSLLKHLKRDSLGIYPEENAQPMTENKIETTHHISEKGDVEEDSEGWKKLDILEDLGIMTEDEIVTDEEFESQMLTEENVRSDRGEDGLDVDEEANYSESDLSQKEGEENLEAEEIMDNDNQVELIDDNIKNTESMGSGGREPTINTERQSVNGDVLPLVNIPASNEMPAENLQPEVAETIFSYQSSEESINTWYNPMEIILDNMFGDDIGEINPIASDENEDSESTKIEVEVSSSRDESRQTDIEEERRSLMNLLKMRIEIALDSVVE